MTKIAVFGSAFNPPSLGHKSVIESLSHFDLVLLVPSISHAWGKTMLEYEHRCDLVDAFILDLDLKNVQRSTVEETLFSPGEAVTTYAVLNSIQHSDQKAEITFVMGPDNLFNFSKFYKAEEILTRWGVMSCPEKVPVRSTDIRQALNKDRTIDHLSTPRVVKMLINNQWYRTL